MTVCSSPSRWLTALAVVILLSPAMAVADEPQGDQEKGQPTDHGKKDDHHSSELTEEHIPLQLEGFPERPKYLLELGNPYLGTGRIKPGIQLPTGAVWQPSLIVFGTLDRGSELRAR